MICLEFKGIQSLVEQENRKMPKILTQLIKEEIITFFELCCTMQYCENKNISCREVAEHRVQSTNLLILPNIAQIRIILKSDKIK